MSKKKDDADHIPPEAAAEPQVGEQPPQDSAEATTAKQAELSALERSMATRPSNGQQEIAAMRQSLESTARELMKDNDMFIVSITYIHADNSGVNAAIIRPPDAGMAKDSPEWKTWEARRRASIMNCSAYLRSAHDTMSRIDRKSTRLNSSH